MDVRMLDEAEYKVAYELYAKGMHALEGSRAERNAELINYYFKLTGEMYSEPNAIMHHRIALYGSPCEKCGKPYRTPKATICVACGNKKQS